MAVRYKDYYKVLGVAKAASQEEIRKAFRGLARQHHPDVARDKKAAESRFKEINEAYEVLGDPEKRRKYDELGQDWDQSGGRAPNGEGFGGGAGNGFSDFFEAFFGQGPGAVRSGAGAGAGPRRPRGFAGRPARRDIEGEVSISLEEFVSGARRRVRVQRSSGVSESMDVTIPAGVGLGQRVRVAGKGEQGGDFLLRVQLAEHPEYFAEGEDVVRRVRVPAWKLVLGGDVEVRTAEGVVRVKLPAGTQPDQRLRLRGRGLPVRGGGRGDFLVQLVVEVPRGVEGERRAIWEGLRALDAAKDLQQGR